MNDWLDELTPEERDGWDQFVAHVRRDAMAKIAASAFVLQLVPEEPDVKVAVELGLAILLDKPLLIVAGEGREIPERLRRIADRVVEADIDVEEGRWQVSAAMDDLMRDGGPCG